MRPGASRRQKLLTIGKDDRILGNPDAPITIIEYASMTCPHCAHFADDVLPEDQEEMDRHRQSQARPARFPAGRRGGARLDDRPLRAARPVLRLDRYLLCRPGQMGDGAGLPGGAARLAELGGMSKEASRQVPRRQGARKPDPRTAVWSPAKELDVNSTPTFFVNGTKYTGEPDGRGVQQAAVGPVGKNRDPARMR